MRTTLTGVRRALPLFLSLARLGRRLAPSLLLAIAAVYLAVQFTPMVDVTAFGQTFSVGAAAPSLSLSGPGEADLFGEGTLKTVQHYNGPIRPRIEWQHFNRNQSAANFLQSKVEHGRRIVRTNTYEVGQALKSGLTSYVWRLLGATAVAVFVIYFSWVGIVTCCGGGRSRRTGYVWLRGLAATLLLSLGLMSASMALTATSAVNQLGGVKSLGDLIGTTSYAPIPDAIGPERKDVDVVVIGDSTAAGLGNTPIVKPTGTDKPCRRSSDAYANVLAANTGLRVLNLACSGATIQTGVIGSQYAGGKVLPSQLGLLKAVTSASVVIVSIGANDVRWSDGIFECYAMASCNDNGSNSLFLSRLDQFSNALNQNGYNQLLQQLSDLPSQPTVIVNLYYDPFGTTFDCPALHQGGTGVIDPPGFGFAADKGHKNQAEKIRQKIDPLRADLDRLNTVLANGAKAFGFEVAQPHFDGHELCSQQPWIQGVADEAPFHPMAAGELAIAAADQGLLPVAKAPAAVTTTITAAGASPAPAS